MFMNRRSLLLGGAALTGGAFLDFGAIGASQPVVNLQLGWILGGNQVGEVCAKALGYYAQEGTELAIQPGGPNIDGVAVVASGRYEVGQVSSSPSLMLASWMLARLDRRLGVRLRSGGTGNEAVTGGTPATIAAYWFIGKINANLYSEPPGPYGFSVNPAFILGAGARRPANK